MTGPGATIQSEKTIELLSLLEPATTVAGESRHPPATDVSRLAG
jgi:hypothetical protein